MMTRSSQQRSIAAIRSAYRGSGNASEIGIPRPSRGTASRNSWFAQIITWRCPLNSAIAAPIARPLATTVPRGWNRMSASGVWHGRGAKADIAAYLLRAQ